MSAYISASLLQRIVEQATGKCEYCLVHQTFSIYSHEIDHVITVKHGGQTTEENLVLACLSCNRYKGSDLTSIDLETKRITALFNPRIQSWTDHFSLCKGLILGVTAAGRTTAFLLRMNEANRLQLRQALISQGLYP